MLMKKNELYSVFNSPSGQPKSIMCACVDGAMDEGPAHEEVQFFGLWSVNF